MLDKLKREVDQLVDDEVKRFCQDDNCYNATVKGSNSVMFQNCSFVISKDLKFSILLYFLWLQNKFLYLC